MKTLLLWQIFLIKIKDVLLKSKYFVLP